MVSSNRMTGNIPSIVLRIHYAPFDTDTGSPAVRRLSMNGSSLMLSFEEAVSFNGWYFMTSQQVGVP